MKFDKFGAFPKSEGIKPQNDNKSDTLGAFLKMLPTLFSKQNQTEKQKVETPKDENKKASISSDTIAYREYLARHDAHVKASKKK